MFVTNDGAISKAIAVEISKVMHSNVRLIVGKPIPTIPFTTPAVKKAATRIATR